MATVGKKFISPDKWEEPWFANLKSGQKLLWQYLWERCDHAGVIHIVLPIWSTHIGQDVAMSELHKLKECVNRDKERMVILGDIVWFTDYIRFNQQPDRNLPLSAKKPFTKNIVKQLSKHNLYDEVKRRDPILLDEWERENCDTASTIPCQTHSNGIGMDASRSTSNSRSGSNGKTIYNSLKEKILGLKLKDINEISLQAEVDQSIESLKKDNVKKPEDYILSVAETFDWEAKEWDDFVTEITGGDSNEVPF